MDAYQLRSPVAFIIFNRPDTTIKVFERIRQSKTPKLFVIADGPRPGNPGEADMCKTARSIIDRVDWPCEVFTNFSEVNLGCKVRVSSGLNWLFNTVEEAIILEDDCVPEPSFFRFCEELLEKYRDDERVMVISGDNFQFGRKNNPYSYYFSRYAHIWGWASWRRAWKNYDVTMQLWPHIHDGGWLGTILHDKRLERYWSRLFEKTHNGEINTWDYQWIFSCMINNGLVIMPTVNLISNIGFRNDATHTTWNSIFGDMPTEPIQFPLSHPSFMLIDARTDARTSREYFTSSNFIRVVHKLKMLQKKYFQKGCE